MLVIHLWLNLNFNDIQFCNTLWKFSVVSWYLGVLFYNHLKELKLSLFNSLYNLYISRTLSYLAYNYKHFNITNIFESGLKRIDFQSAVCNNTNIVRDGNKVSLTFGEGESTAQCLKAELVDSNDKTLVSKRLRTTADSCKC